MHEHVTGKEGELKFDATVFPPSNARVERKENVNMTLL